MHEIISLTIILIFSFFLQIRKMKMPLHQDTAQTIYRGIMKAKGEKFIPFKKKLEVLMKSLLPLNQVSR